MKNGEIKVFCPCGEEYAAERQHVGGYIRCRKCGKTHQIVDSQPIATTSRATPVPAKSTSPPVQVANRKSRWATVTTFAGVLAIVIVGIVWLTMQRQVGVTASRVRPEPAPITKPPSTVPDVEWEVVEELPREQPHKRTQRSDLPIHRPGKPPQSAPPPKFEEEYVGNDAEPTVSITNKADRPVHLVVGDLEFTLSPDEFKSVIRTAGNERFNASARNVIPLAGSKDWKRGYRYTWTFWIERTRIP